MNVAISLCIFENPCKSWKNRLKEEMLSMIWEVLLLFFCNTFCLVYFSYQDQEKKNYLFPSERPGEIFFLTMRPVNLFRNNRWIKKILNRKKKENEISWKNKNAWSFFYVSLFTYISLRSICFNWCNYKCFS